YYPRESIQALARQYFKYGKGRARTLLKHRNLSSIKPTLAFLGLAGEALVLIAAPWQLGGLSLVGYALATGAEAVRVGHTGGLAAAPGAGGGRPGRQENAPPPPGGARARPPPPRGRPRRGARGGPQGVVGGVFEHL